MIVLEGEGKYGWESLEEILRQMVDSIFLVNAIQKSNFLNDFQVRNLAIPSKPQWVVPQVKQKG